MKKIVVILGHPGREHPGFCAAIAVAYTDAAIDAGHHVDFIKVAELLFDPILHEGYKGNQPAETDIHAAQERIRHADHIVIIYPLWQFMIPALLKGFFERTLTLGFAYKTKSKTAPYAQLLKGKSARLIQTMGMPTFVYRFYFMAHGAKALKSMLRFCGVSPIRMTYFGSIENVSDIKRQKFLTQTRELGRSGQ